jgi:NTP pyrophosphatase (non-canonical NTP hydrolase)
MAHTPLTKIQEEHADWSARKFGYQSGAELILIAVEEMGELAHAHTRGCRAKYKTSTEPAGGWRLHCSNGVGDVVIALMGYCSKLNLDFPMVVERVWEELKGERQ